MRSNLQSQTRTEESELEVGQSCEPQVTPFLQQDCTAPERALPAGDHVFKLQSLWETFPIQTTTYTLSVVV